MKEIEDKTDPSDLEEVKASPLSPEQENQEIETLARQENRSRMIRRFMITLIILGATSVILKPFLSGSKPYFNALDTIAYEALMLEQSQEPHRLNFPNDDLTEISDYFAKDPNLGFISSNFARLPQGWMPIGASIYDYGIAKVTVVQITNSQNKLYLFETMGKLDDLPSSTAIKEQGRSFHSYADDHFNIIAWQQNQSTLAFLVGKPNVKDLVAFANQSVTR